MLLQHLQSLRAHGEWADTLLLRAVTDSTADNSAVLRELAHVRSGQDLWLARIQDRAGPTSVWPTWSLQQLEVAGQRVDAEMRSVLSQITVAQLETPLTYTNLAGDTFTTPIGEILLHVLMHGHYHRGKANVALREAGVTAASIDYITWQREAAALQAQSRKY